MTSPLAIRRPWGRAVLAQGQLTGDSLQRARFVGATLGVVLIFGRRAAASLIAAALIAAALIACRGPASAPARAGQSSAPLGAPAAAYPRLPSLDARAAELFETADAHGAVVVCDIATGDTLASVGVGRDVMARGLPLSTIKLYTAALWWAHRLGDGDFDIPRHGHVTLHDALVSGYDRPGELAAIELRRRLGAQRVLDELRGYGLAGLTLPADADDAAWGQALSIGERDVTVTLREVAGFLRTAPARALDLDLRAAVARGTASSVATWLEGTGWQLGGKTGTGPNVVGPTSDGWFAGVIFEADVPRYSIAVFVEHRGPGGGVAASIAACLARELVGAAERSACHARASRASSWAIREPVPGRHACRRLSVIEVWAVWAARTAPRRSAAASGVPDPAGTARASTARPRSAGSRAVAGTRRAAAWPDRARGSPGLSRYRRSGRRPRRRPRSSAAGAAHGRP